MKRALGTAALALLTAGCASTYAIAPQASTGQGVRYERGTPTVVSVQPHGVVRVSPAAKSYQDRVVLNVVAFNNGPDPANLGYENLSVAAADGTPMRLFTVAELEREAKTKAAWAAFAVALAGAANTYAAQQSAYSYGYGHVSTYGRYGSTFSTYSYRTYNPVAANVLTRQAADDTAAGIGQISAALDATIAGLEGHVLQTTTIDVGHIDGGQVVVERPRMAKDALAGFTVRVAFNGDTHEFRFNAGSEAAIAQLPALAPVTAPPPPQPALATAPTPAPMLATAVSHTPGGAVAAGAVRTEAVLRTDAPAPVATPTAVLPPAKQPTRVGKRWRCPIYSPDSPDSVSC